MPRKIICLVGPSWTLERAQKRHCKSHEHRHVNEHHARKLVLAGEARWLLGGIQRGRLLRGSVLQDKEEAARHLNRLSIEVGGPHAMMVYQGNRIAVEMLSQIRRRTLG